MSTIATSEPLNSNSIGPKSKKHKKKKGGGKAKPNGDLEKHHEIANDEENGIDEADLDKTDFKTNRGPESPSCDAGTPLKSPKLDNSNSTTNGTSVAASHPLSPTHLIDSLNKSHEASNHTVPQDAGGSHRETLDSPPTPLSDDAEAMLDALARERSSLRDEVTELRRSLEQVQERHEEELTSVREQLAETKEEKEHSETQYRNLLGKMNSIRSQLGERLKADAEDLSQARKRIEDLEAECVNLRKQNETRDAELATMAEENEQRSKELSSLRNRTTLSQQNWSKEREDLIQRELFAKNEFEAAKQAMQDWEVLAMEERSIRENIAERVAYLEEQLSNQHEAYTKAASERDSQSLTVDGLQRALQEIQDARRRELRELVENSQTQIESLQKQVQESETGAAEAKTALESTRKELERALPFEKEVKEKNLLIGKLRHEAVILNDHLTKALRYLKKGKPDENIDKQVITNHFLHFLALERSDSKKFQVLQIIAGLLAWTDEQREQAGLARPGASNPTLRVPVSPWHRTPSTPALSTDFFPDGGSRKESLAELWSDFLEQEAREGGKSPSSPSVSGPARPN